VAALLLSPRRGVHQKKEPILKSLPKNARARAIAFICTCLVPLAAWAGDDAERIRAVVDAAVLPLMSRYDVPGMAVAVTVDGRPYLFDYGLASRESKAPVDEKTIFEIGSLSKTFTATLAAYAQETGKLSLDDHPGKYVPSLRGHAIDKASLLHLATYTAGGLPLQFPDEVEGNDATLAYFRHWKADAAPGTEREYSNASLGLFGYVTAVALEDDFAHAIETRIFPAFGMGHSYIHVPEGAMPDYAWGYVAAKPHRVSPGPFDEETYGVKTTASDLLRFVQANMDPSGLAAPMQRAVAATHVGYFRSGVLVQGLGWEQYAWPVSRELLLGGNSAEAIFDANPAQRLVPPVTSGARLFDKTGSTGGFGAYVAFVPSRRIGVVLLANRNYPIPARVEAGFAILDRLAGNAH
jgi:beta-lactamase class C